jgi:hypothetical protein
MKTNPNNPDEIETINYHVELLGTYRIVKISDLDGLYKKIALLRDQVELLTDEKRALQTIIKEIEGDD